MLMQQIDFIVRGQLQEIMPVGNAFKQGRHAGQPVVLAGKMRPSAAPRIIARFANEARGDRVHFNVPCRCQEMAFIHGERSKSFLPQMPSPLFAAIDAPGVPPVRFADGTGKAVHAGGDGNEVNMVWHQAPSPDGDVVGIAPLRHQLDIGEVISFAKKHLL